MNKHDILRNLGMFAMFFGGYMGAQSLWWGWVTAVLGAGIMGLALWLSNKK